MYTTGLHETATLTPLRHTPCRSRASAGGHPPSQEPQKCSGCGSELAAKWFTIQRSSLSGRRSKCRLGLIAGTGLACESVSSTWRPGHVTIPRSDACSMPSAPLTRKGKCAHPCAGAQRPHGQCWPCYCRTCVSEYQQEHAAAIHDKSSALPADKQCRRCNEVRLHTSIHTVKVEFVALCSESSILHQPMSCFTQILMLPFSCCLLSTMCMYCRSRTPRSSIVRTEIWMDWKATAAPVIYR